MLDLVFRFMVISPHRNDFSVNGFQKNSYSAIERLTIECRKINNHHNHSCQSQQAQTTPIRSQKNPFELLTNLTNRESSPICKLMTAYDKEKPKRTRINFKMQLKTFLMLTIVPYVPSA